MFSLVLSRLPVLLIACGKLDARISSAALTLPGRHIMNLGALGFTVLLGAWFLGADSVTEGMFPLIVMTVVAGVLGVHLILAIGGADMPVVVSMLNSYFRLGCSIHWLYVG